MALLVWRTCLLLVYVVSVMMIKISMYVYVLASDQRTRT